MWNKKRPGSISTRHDLALIFIGQIMCNEPKLETYDYKIFLLYGFKSCSAFNSISFEFIYFWQGFTRYSRFTNLFNAYEKPTKTFLFSRVSLFAHALRARVPQAFKRISHAPRKQRARRIPLIIYTPNCNLVVQLYGWLMWEEHIPIFEDTNLSNLCFNQFRLRYFSSL